MAPALNPEQKKIAATSKIVMNDTIVIKSVINCPVCGYKKEEEMPADACQYFYQCKNCQTVLKPVAGDCCVFCSYGTVKCSPVLQGTCCC